MIPSCINLFFPPIFIFTFIQKLLNSLSPPPSLSLSISLSLAVGCGKLSSSLIDFRFDSIFFLTIFVCFVLIDFRDSRECEEKFVEM